MPIIKLNSRTRLRKFLEGQLKLMERKKIPKPMFLDHCFEVQRRAGGTQLR